MARTDGDSPFFSKSRTNWAPIRGRFTEAAISVPPIPVGTDLAPNKLGRSSLLGEAPD